MLFSLQIWAVKVILLPVALSLSRVSSCAHAMGWGYVGLICCCWDKNVSWSVAVGYVILQSNGWPAV